jgi:hypothetical protein
MSDQPTPPALAGGQALGRTEALARASGPATGLIVVGGLGVVWSIFSILLNVFSTGAGMLGSSGDDAGLALLSGGIGIGFAVLSLVFDVLIVLGGLKMKNLQSPGFAVAAAVLAMLPCGLCCLIGVPIGIWALTVLTDQNVKSQFQ